MNLYQILSNMHFPVEIKEKSESNFIEKKTGDYMKKVNTKNCKSTNFILSVSDNGVGIPENLDIEELDSLGHSACNFPCRPVRWRT